MRAFLLEIGYDRWILPTLVFLPLAGAFALWIHGFFAVRAFRTGPANDDVARWMTFAVFLAQWVLAIGLWWAYDPAGPAYQLEFAVPWIERWGIAFHLGVDGISLFLVLLTAFMMPIAVLSGWTSIDKGVHTYHALFLLLTCGMTGVFMARDIFLFYVCWEIVLVPMYFIIGIWGGERRIYAATKFFLYTLVGSLLMLVAVLYLGIAAKNPVTGRPDFAYDRVFATLLSPTETFWLFLAFFSAFAVKIPLFPFHTWLPDAHVEAPTEGSVDLAAILLKMGTYGLLRFLLPLFPGAALSPLVRDLVVGCAVIGVIYGALVALVQPDFKKLVAYSSVSHMGLVVLGIFALNVEAVQGAMLVQLGHGLSTGMLFLMIGMLYDRRHSRSLDAFGGIARVMPLYAAFLMLAVLSSIGVPGTNGFVGEFLTLLGSFQRFPVAAMIATLTVVLSAVYLLAALQRVIFNALDKRPNRLLFDLNRREFLMVLPLAGMILWLGVYPTPFLRRMEPSVRRFVAEVETKLGQQTLAARDGRVR